VVIDADGGPDEVAERVFTGLRPVLPKPPAAPAADPAGVGT
jgi:dTMP kinase